ncbi:hypothetical protein [Streptococcus devriesei]|uniref:hypothetical protein n=1 Tax=Streptococcus devriesei TaxID=231233 RepID=UPI0003F998D1|nr:hypothetical protein [Streptococcus devriesei]
MVSVTQRIKQIKQPYGGYLPPKLFSVDDLTDSKELSGEENIHASLVGLCVDYLTRFMNGTPLEEAFKISLYGALMIKKSELASTLLSQITGLDDTSIISACQLAGFDVVYRAGQLGYKPVEEIVPDAATILNIRIMVERSLAFFEEYGPIVKDGFTLEGGYTDTITAGDGDFLTSDTLWDFKVSKSKPNKDQTLQLLIYYLMGQQSIHPEFQSIEKLGLYNPRQNKVFLLNIADISADILETVKKEVIRY